MADALRVDFATNGKALYNLGCVYLDLREFEKALACLAQAIDAGFQNPALAKLWKGNDALSENALLDELIERMV
jgi:tetratricopeptide (TPR) repeat protein